MQGLKGKTILITGANGLFGRAIAERLAAAGCRLVLTDKTEQAVNDVLAATSQAEQKIGLAGDIAKEKDVAYIFAEAEKQIGIADGLVNAAAILDASDGDILTTTPDCFRQTLETNLTGIFLTCREAVRRMRQHNGGAIVNFSSVVAHVGSAEAQLAYTTAKGGVEAMTREIAIAHARHHIRANCIAAGPVKSDRNAHYFDTPEKWQARRRHIPMGRLGRAEEIAGAACFLLSDDAGYITGHSLLVDGGIANAYLIHDENGDAMAGGDMPSDNKSKTKKKKPDDDG